MYIVNVVFERFFFGKLLVEESFILGFRVGKVLSLDVFVEVVVFE